MITFDLLDFLVGEFIPNNPVSSHLCHQKHDLFDFLADALLLLLEILVDHCFCVCLELLLDLFVLDEELACLF